MQHSKGIDLEDAAKRGVVRTSSVVKVTLIFMQRIFSSLCDTKHTATCCHTGHTAICSHITADVTSRCA
jgi:hypothetical protein